eukprot:2830089-Alexandrium_andersonii.AAC.1
MGSASQPARRCEPETPGHRGAASEKTTEAGQEVVAEVRAIARELSVKVDGVQVCAIAASCECRCSGVDAQSTTGV